MDLTRRQPNNPLHELFEAPGTEKTLEATKNAK